ncbi:hypothetical protein Zmor_005098 [Zophobas morio]|uniref:Uncharacterized protein n=1 Tax=Zophobas morio TaxID=2755281 RepID=A0AA38IX90_9CUCU|nr:hypothetical protein Zmor_005098 [Zophobas morio]
MADDEDGSNTDPQKYNNCKLCKSYIGVNTARIKCKNCSVCSILLCFENLAKLVCIREDEWYCKSCESALDDVHKSAATLEYEKRALQEQVLLLLNKGTKNADAISDHRLVFAELKICSPIQKLKYITLRNLKQINNDRFQLDLSSISWDNIFYFPTIDEKLEYLTTKILLLFDIHAPLRTIRITKPKAPWLTNVLKLIFRERDLAYSNYKEHKAPENWNKYKNVRNFALASLRREKKAYLVNTCK